MPLLPAPLLMVLGPAVAGVSTTQAGLRLKNRTVDDGRRGPAAFQLYASTDDASVAPSGATPPFVVALGVASDAGACGALCGSWHNASDAAQRCESFTLYGSNSPHLALQGKCFGHVSVAWFANPSAGDATSGRMRWPCRDALDCSLNGHCSPSGGCTCSAGWVGLRCGELDVLPVNKSQLGFVPGPTTSSWGGAVTRSHHDTAGWKMYTAKMTNNCGINSWWTNSEVVRAVAPSPFGPFTESSSAGPMWPAFSTGPGVSRGPGGELVVGLTMGKENGSTSAVPFTNCTDGSTPKPFGGFPRPVRVAPTHSPFSYSWIMVHQSAECTV